MAREWTQAYLKEFNQLCEEFKGKSVGIFAVCAEEQNKVDKAQKDWGLNFKCFSDPTHVLRNYLAEQGLVTIVVSGGENSTDSAFYKVHPTIKHYKYGVAQPGILCVTPEKKVLFAWAINPSLMNIGGASDRPVPRDIWTVIQTKLVNPDGDTTTRIRSRGNCSICTVL